MKQLRKEESKPTIHRPDCVDEKSKASPTATEFPFSIVYFSPERNKMKKAAQLTATTNTTSGI